MPKKIVLCADGTGNARSSLFRTNVWKLYDALDLSSSSDQIAYYHDGVGTSSFAPVKLLGGIFGYGVAANVRDVYAFLCRNYEVGDQIYVFGFSRGAFTARILAGFISTMGVPSLKDDDDIDAWTRKAFLHYRRTGNWSRYGTARRGLVWLWRHFRDLFDSKPVKAHDEQTRAVAFVGVWDTVSAYGGPIVEMVRAWDRWIYPLSFADYVLPDNVKCARHALALDEEREAFGPLLWDECKSGPRVKQVWFAGVHSDVGGGYPDQGLSNVPLCWMMEQTAASPGGALTFIPDAEKKIRIETNALGPRHDSRSGVSQSYRYQPRRISVWTQHAHFAPSRDPATGPDPMIKEAVVHTSVIQRQRHGLDGYAPIVLPSTFRDTDGTLHALDPERQKPIVVLATRRRKLQLMLLITGLLMVACPSWRSPWSREFYHGLTGLGVVLKPLLWVGYAIDVFNQMLAGSVRAVLGATPGVPQWVANAYAESGGYLIAGGLLLAWLLACSSRTQRRTETAARAMWATAYDPPPTPPPLKRTAWDKLWWPVRQFFRWRAVPDLLGITYWLVGAWVVLAIVNQISLALYARSNDWCATPATSRIFHTRDRCFPLSQQVYKGQVFQLRMAIPSEPSAQWNDHGTIASPAGFSSVGSISQQVLAWSPIGVAQSTFAHLFGTALRQNIGTRWFAPIIAVKPTPEMLAQNGGNSWVRTAPVMMQLGHDRVYQGTFVAPATGRAYLYLNDATLPFFARRNLFYDNNCGWAHVALLPTYRRNRHEEAIVLDATDQACAAKQAGK